ncbi:hypothetical protein KY289_001382 [Solanum tuberosum]|nr:hypothetical protein KY289_001382 [Solanum tuberosum]
MFVHTENTWNERYQHVVQINHQANPIDYFNWYLRHSHKFIANAEHVVQYGYLPIAGRYEAFAMGHERLYRMNQAIENDNTQSFQVRDNARQMTSYSRDAMNVAHLNTRMTCHKIKMMMKLDLHNNMTSTTLKEQQGHTYPPPVEPVDINNNNNRIKTNDNL